MVLLISKTVHIHKQIEQHKIIDQTHSPTIFTIYIANHRLNSILLGKSI